MRRDATPHGPWLRARWDVVSISALVVYFAVKAVYFALRIHPGIPPDEGTHAGRALIFATSWTLPGDSPRSYPVGLVTHVPILYYALMGRVASVDIPGLRPLLVMRLANVLLGVATVLYGWAWIRLASANRLARVLFVAMLTNTLMFTAISGAVSYDNLTNLLAAMSVFYLTRFNRERRSVDAAACLASVAAGALTKLAFLPLGASVLLVAAVHNGRQFRDVARDVAAEWRRRRPGALAVYSLAALFATWALALYGGNLVAYGSLQPSADRVVGLEAALEERTFAMEYVIRQYRNGNWTHAEAVAAADRLIPSGDRETAKVVVSTLEARRRGSESVPLMEPPEFALAWLQSMLLRASTYTGFRAMEKSPAHVYPYLVLLGVAAIVLIGTWRHAENDGLTTWSALIVAIYALFLIYAVSYPIYRSSAVFGLYLQGRYMFPVLLPLYGLVADLLLRRWPKGVQVALVLLIGGFFAVEEFVYFHLHSTPAWFTTVSWIRGR